MSIFKRKPKPAPKKKTKPTLEREKLEAEIRNLKSSPWIRITTIIVTIITVVVIWNNKALEIYNANLTSDIKKKEGELIAINTINKKQTDSIAIYSSQIKSLSLAKQYYDSILTAMNGSSDSKKKLIAGMAKNVTDLRNLNSSLSDSFFYYKQLYALQNHELIIPGNQTNWAQVLAANSSSIPTISTGQYGTLYGLSNNSLSAPLSSQQPSFAFDSNGNLISSNQLFMNPTPIQTFGQSATVFNGQVGTLWNPSTSTFQPAGTSVQFPTLDSAIRYFYSQQNKNGILNTTLLSK